MPTQDPTPTLPEMMATANAEAPRPEPAGTSPDAPDAQSGPDPETVTAYDHLWFRGRPLS